MQDVDNNNDSSEGKGGEQVSLRQMAEEPEGADYYFNEEGLLTFTSKYLLKRGYCCGNGCKHCPYDYEAVPEPKRSFLLEKRNDTNNNESVQS